MITTRLLRIALLAFFSGCMTAASAQLPGTHPPISPITVGSISVNGGIGPGEPYLGGDYNRPFGIKASVNWGVAEAGPGVITVGASVGGSFANGIYISRAVPQTTTSMSSNSIVFSARAAWHYGWQVPGLDLYGGLSLGEGFHRYHIGQPVNWNSNTTHLWPGIFAGASYFFTPRFGINAEAGADITNFQFGVVAKI